MYCELDSHERLRNARQCDSTMSTSQQFWRFCWEIIPSGSSSVMAIMEEGTACEKQKWCPAARQHAGLVPCGAQGGEVLVGLPMGPLPIGSIDAARPGPQSCTTLQQSYSLTGVVTHLGNRSTAVHMALTEDAFGVSLLLYTGAVLATPGAAPLPPIEALTSIGHLIPIAEAACRAAVEKMCQSHSSRKGQLADTSSPLRENRGVWGGASGKAGTEIMAQGHGTRGTESEVAISKEKCNSGGCNTQSSDPCTVPIQIMTKCSLEHRQLAGVLPAYCKRKDRILTTFIAAF
ncbi:hypothetical protein Anapl_13444 [Anas platyrhynchos]|uniref:Uncharacterized protein n=1 Tax=Anas platyrhynchos TaxID=8839 RepID=R0M3Y1_ANAPL|nr:hypothetical protein Anapl_13444 [Anas platyrhynchos]